MLDSYSLIEELNKGRRFGRNFKGIRKEDGLEVSIKIVQQELHDARALEQLRNEASFSFESQQLPQVLDFQERDEGFILIKKWLPGKDLMSFKKELKRREVFSFLKRVVQELTALLNEVHAQNIIHLDIKPSNIFIDGTAEDFKVHLGDFGLALRKNEVPNRKLLFPLGYAGPELILNQLDLVDERTDQFALGVTLWHFMTDKLPLTHANPSIFTNLQLTHPIPSDPQVPKLVQEKIEKMCSKFQFGVPPNQMDTETVRSYLVQAMNKRYNSLNDLNEDFQMLAEKKSLYQRMSFR